MTAYSGYMLKLFVAHHFNSPRLRMLRLGQIEGQHTVVVAGLGPFGVDGGGQREALLVLAGLEAIPVDRRPFWDVYSGLPLEGDGVLLGGDFNSIRIGARHWYLEDEALFGLEQVCPNTSTTAQHVARNEAVLKEAIHRVTQGN